MPRALSLAIVLLSAGCYRSHVLPFELSADAGSVVLVPDAGATHVGDDGELARCFSPSVAAPVVVGPERHCVGLSVEPRPSGGCRTLAAEHLGTALRIARRDVGRVDLRVSCAGPCRVFAISPDACDGCNEVPFEAGFAAPRFAESQVDGLLELVIEGGSAELEVCFDPDYGPPPWGD
jgi:hypothetical protein